jgi:hypothetical protein
MDKTRLSEENDSDVNILTKSMGRMSHNFTIGDVANIIKRYGLSCDPKRIFNNYNGDEQNIRNVLEKQRSDKVLASNRGANAFLNSSRVAGIHKGGKKSRRNTRRRKYSKKQKPSRKQTRRHRHRHRRSRHRR